MAAVGSTARTTTLWSKPGCKSWRKRISIPSTCIRFLWLQPNSIHHTSFFFLFFLQKWHHTSCIRLTQEVPVIHRQTDWCRFGEAGGPKPSLPLFIQKSNQSQLSPPWAQHPAQTSLWWNTWDHQYTWIYLCHTPFPLHNYGHISLCCNMWKSTFLHRHTARQLLPRDNT